MNSAQSTPAGTAGIKLLSKYLSAERLGKMLGETNAYFPRGHFQFPLPTSCKEGNHLEALFVLAPIARNPEMVEWIAEDVVSWVRDNQIEFDIILAPGQLSAVKITRSLAEKLHKPVCIWEFLPSGWFGERPIEGDIQQGQSVLIFNGVSQTGNCINNRLPGFVEKKGGNIAGVAVFARGDNEGNLSAVQRFGNRLHAAIEVHIPFSPAARCSICQQPEAPALIPWTDKEVAV